MSNQVTDVGHVAFAPEVCEDCGCKLRREDWDDEPDTGCVACVTFTCQECDRCWFAAPERKDGNHD